MNDRDYWNQRWLDGRTGWHMGQAHNALVRYFERLALAAGDSVFVPLCGCSPDMSWIAAKNIEVVGCEFSQLAIERFFQDVGLVAETSRAGELVEWRAGPYRIFEGDYFALKPELLTGVKAVYDRASIISMDKDGERGRKAYVKKMRELTPDGTRYLLVAFDYDQSEMAGPPFAMNYEEVVYQFAYDHIIEFLDKKNILQIEPRFREKGLTRLAEWVFLLERYQPMYADVSDWRQDF